MIIDYFQEWLPLDSRPVGKLTEEVARHRHQKGSRYVALVGGEGTPEAAVVVESAELAVYFLNSDGSPAFLYVFERCSPTDLFLSQIVTYHSGGADGQPALSVMAFSQDGSMEAEVSDLAGDLLSQREGSVDVTSHWEEFPEFGDYSRVLVEERAVQLSRS